MDSFHLIKGVLSEREIAEIREALSGIQMQDGRRTAKGMARNVKHNLQVTGREAPELIGKLAKKISTHPAVRRLAMPRSIGSVMISRYDPGMEYGLHTDAPVMAGGLRADLSFTIFLSDPASYDGGELALESLGGERKIKLSPGSMVLYPTGVLHRVTALTRGERLAVVGWVQSRIRDAHKRQIVLDLDVARQAYLQKAGHDRTADLLLKTSANLRRMWDD